MAKKLIKYGKFLMSVALIFCLMAPSYASLSASDGSAFVTKGEFDSAMADFNTRLTTFEAGINSKIDSQVTSYLDRNGIWSGKAIDDIHGKEIYITQTAADRSRCYDATRDQVKNNTKIFVQKEFLTNKSGLVVINFRMNAANSANVIHVSYTGYSCGRDSTFYLFNDIVDINTGIRKYFNIFSYGIAANLSAAQDTARCLVSEFAGTISYFTIKGDRYYFRVGDFWDYGARKVDAQETTGIPYPWYFSILDAEVY